MFGQCPSEKSMWLVNSRRWAGRAAVRLAQTAALRIWSTEWALVQRSVARFSANWMAIRLVEERCSISGRIRMGCQRQRHSHLYCSGIGLEVNRQVEHKQTGQQFRLQRQPAGGQTLRTPSIQRTRSAAIPDC